MQLRSLNEFATLYKEHKRHNQPLPSTVTICPAFQYASPKIVEADTIILQEALMSQLCPQNFVLRLNRFELQQLGADAIGNALASGKLPNRFKLILEHNIPQSKKKLSSVKAKQQYFHEKAMELIQPIANALKKKNACPENFHLELKLNRDATSHAVELLSSALTEGNGADGFTLTLGNEISDQATKSLVHYLKSTRFPRNFGLYFTHTNHVSIDALAESLTSAPPGFKLMYQISQYDSSCMKHWFDVFSQTISSGKYPEGLCIGFYNDRSYQEISDDSVCQLLSALSTAPTALTISLIRYQISVKSLQHLANVLTNGKYPENFKLLGLQIINKDLLDMLIKSISIYHYRPGLEIRLATNRDDKGEAQDQLNHALNQAETVHKNLRENAYACTVLLQGYNKGSNRLPLQVLKSCFEFLSPFPKADNKTKYDRIFCNNIVNKKWNHSLSMFSASHSHTPMDVSSDMKVAPSASAKRQRV